MKTHKLRNRFAAAASLGAAGVLAAMTVGVAPASANVPPDPSYETAPQFNNGTVNAIRDSGSDTTFFMMQTIGDLYTSAGLYGCTLNSATGQGLFNDTNNGVTPYPATQEEYFCQGSHLAVGNIVTTSGSATITLTSGNFPSSIAAGQSVNSLAPSGQFASGTTVVGTSGSPITSVTLSNNASTTTSGTTVLSFASQPTANTFTTDTVDNWSRTEVSEGVDDVGSGAGQGQLCGNTPTPLPVDFARSSKPIVSTSSGGCLQEAELGYAKDGVPLVDFDGVNPSTFGTSTFDSTAAPYSTVNGGNIGPVAAGWLPGDPVNGSANNGSSLASSGISNADNGGGASSTLYRIYCATGSTAITDWGQITNLGPNLELAQVTTSTSSATVTIPATLPDGAAYSVPSAIAAGQSVSGPGIPSGTTVVSTTANSITLSNTPTANSTTATLTFVIPSKLATGQGVPFGLPVRVMGVNPSSGTEATFASYAKGTASSGCSNTNSGADVSNDPNSATAPAGNPAQVALENNASQVGLFASGDFPNPDYVDQAIEAATTLYYESNGVVNSNPHAGTVTINGTNYTITKINENGRNYTTANILNNFLPTARTLFNIYRTDTIRASTAGFLNWICDSNAAFTKGSDNTTGQNFDTELTTIIQNEYGFIRLNDNSAPPSHGGVPADNVAAPNTTCAPSIIGVDITSGSSTLTLSGSAYPQKFPASFANGDTIVGDGIPSGTTIVSGGGTTTLTISQNASATTTSGTVSVPGQPAITSVPAANLNS